MLFDEPELDWRTGKAELLAQLTFHVALVAPVQELGLATEDFECGSRIIGFLHHVVELWLVVLQPGWRVAVDDFVQPFVKVFGGEFLASAVVDF